MTAARTTQPLSPHQRIMRAAKKGRGVRLSWAEVQYLSGDYAIQNRAATDDAGESQDSFGDFLEGIEDKQ